LAKAQAANKVGKRDERGGGCRKIRGCKEAAAAKSKEAEKEVLEEVVEGLCISSAEEDKGERGGKFGECAAYVGYFGGYVG
jgi:hypothetical protein